MQPPSTTAEALESSIEGRIGDPSPPESERDGVRHEPEPEAEDILEGDCSADDMGSILEAYPNIVASENGGASDSDLEDHTASVYRYARTTYPRVEAAFQVEHPFDNCEDGATIDSSRSIYDATYDQWVWENGRRYCGDYSMPNDLSEQTRQYVIHQVYLRLFDLKLTTVPLEDPTYILDIGTGIGEWAVEIAEKYPDCDVYGTDIAPIQPTNVPFNVEFHIEDAEEEWIRPASAVDLVHLRNLAGAFSDWSFIYQQAFECIKPGGYIEILDFDEHRGMQNFVSWFPEGSAVEVVTSALRRASVMDGRPKGVDHMDRQLLIDAGFTDIKEDVYDIPLGRHENSKFGEDWLFACLTGVEATCLRLLTKYMGWDTDYVRTLCDTVSVEMKRMADDKKRAKGFVVKLRVLVGRKPEVPGQWTAQALTENGEIEYSEDEHTVKSGTEVASSATSQYGGS